MECIKKVINYISMILLIIIIFYINIRPIAVIDNKITYLELSKGLFNLGIVCFILYIMHKILYREKPKIKDILIVLLSVCAYFSYYFAIDKMMALNGTVGRNEGLLSILAYYSIFLLASTISSKYQKNIMKIILITGFFQIAIGTIQCLKITNIFGYNREYNWSTNFGFASGTFGNPNFYSTYILMCLMYTYGILF